MFQSLYLSSLSDFNFTEGHFFQVCKIINHAFSYCVSTVRYVQNSILFINILKGR
jgi:hypothetical protein